jgi:acetolactate synthase-1/2/3 large subunit/sulfoacetaldehyde acetyltransferase
MSQMTAGQAVVESLRAEGVQYVFGIIGGTFQPITNALYNRQDIRFVSTRHEQGAAFMADGYARASGRPGACVATPGPGVTNLVTGIYAAHMGHSPVIAMSGGPIRDLVYRDASQEADHVSIMKSITKHAMTVNKAERIPELFRHAFRIAMSGKKGPVFIDIPRDLLETRDMEVDLSPPRSYRMHHRPPGDPELVRQAVETLKQAQRPLIIAGGGVKHGDASEQVAQMADLLSIPMVTTYQDADAVPNSHPLYVGSLGNNVARSSPEAAELCAQADVILAVGTRLTGLSTGYDNRSIGRNVKIIQIEIDEKEIGRFYPMVVGIQGDAGAVVQGMLDILRAEGAEGGGAAWPGEAVALKERRRRRLEAEASSTATPLRAQRVYGEMRKVVPPEAIMVLDAGTCPGIGFDRLEFHRPRTLIAPGNMAGLGFAFPVALGAKMGRPEAPVIAVHGDGGFLFNVQELETAVREKIATVTIVMNNNEWGSEKLQQLRNYPGQLVGTEMTNPRLDKLAELFGARGFYVERAEEMGEALKEALASDLPSIIEVPVEPIAQTVPMS